MRWKIINHLLWHMHEGRWFDCSFIVVGVLAAAEWEKQAWAKTNTLPFFCSHETLFIIIIERGVFSLSIYYIKFSSHRCAIYAFSFAFGRSILLAYGIHIKLTPLSSLSTAILHDLSIGSTSNKYYAINIHLIVNFYFSLALNFIRISRKIWAFKIDDSAFVVR